MLRWYNSTDHGTFELTNRNTIGASTDCDINVRGIAPINASIERIGSRYWIREHCGPITINGMVVDGQKRLEAGDVIRIGPNEHIIYEHKTTRLPMVNSARRKSSFSGTSCGGRLMERVQKLQMELVAKNEQVRDIAYNTARHLLSIITSRLVSFNDKISRNPHECVFTSLLRVLNTPIEQRLKNVASMCDRIDGIDAAQLWNSSVMIDMMRELEETESVVREAAASAKENVRLCRVMSEWSRRVAEADKSDDGWVQIASNMLLDSLNKENMNRHWIAPTLIPIFELMRKESMKSLEDIERSLKSIADNIHEYSDAEKISKQMDGIQHQINRICNQIGSANPRKSTILSIDITEDDLHKSKDLPIDKQVINGLNQDEAMPIIKSPKYVTVDINLINKLIMSMNNFVEKLNRDEVRNTKEDDNLWIKEGQRLVESVQSENKLNYNDYEEESVSQKLKEEEEEITGRCSNIEEYQREEEEEEEEEKDLKSSFEDAEEKETRFQEDLESHNTEEYSKDALDDEDVEETEDDEDEAEVEEEEENDVNNDDEQIESTRISILDQDEQSYQTHKLQENVPNDSANVKTKKLEPLRISPINRRTMIPRVHQVSTDNVLRKHPRRKIQSAVPASEYDDQSISSHLRSHMNTAIRRPYKRIDHRLERRTRSYDSQKMKSDDRPPFILY